MNSNIKANAWSNYWNKGFLTTFVDSEQENYSGLIKHHWESAFALVPEGGIMVDLGAGNGAILALAKQFMVQQQKSFRLVAVDYADISQLNGVYAQHPDITLRGNTQIEATGIATESVDLCVSQFGFEYAERTPAATEVARILKPKGRFSALLHHVESHVAIRAKSALEQIEQCRHSELADTTSSLLLRLHKLETAHRPKKGDNKASKLRNKFNRRAKRLTQSAKLLPDGDHIAYFLNELGGLFSHQAHALNFNQKMDIIKRLRTDSNEYHSRMQSMLQACNDSASIKALVKVFGANAIHLDTPEQLKDAGYQFAWVVSGQKTG